MSRARSEEIKRAQLYALLKVKEQMKQAKSDGINYKLTNQKIADIINGGKVKWVEKYITIINKSKSQSAGISDEKLQEEVVVRPSNAGRPPKFTPRQIKSVTVDCVGKKRRSIRKTRNRFNNNPHNPQTISTTTIWEKRKKLGMRGFHQRNAPMITKLNKKHRIALAKYFLDKFEYGLHPLHMIFSDEFMIYHLRKINTKNDIIWAFCIEDIPNKLL